jgi:hypothetical protein
MSDIYDQEGGPIKAGGPTKKSKAKSGLVRPMVHDRQSPRDSMAIVVVLSGKFWEGNGASVLTIHEQR